MKNNLNNNEEYKDKFTKEEMNEMLDPHNYIGKDVEKVDNLIKFLREKYKNK